MVSSCFITFFGGRGNQNTELQAPPLRFHEGRAEPPLSNLYKSGHHQFFLYFPLILYQERYYGLYEASIKIGGCNPQVWMTLIQNLFLIC